MVLKEALEGASDVSIHDDNSLLKSRGTNRRGNRYVQRENLH